jgi:Rps23 Pro-64 3,4-dihydroxylase Tpa1-like proline 4-hydroxylase
MIITDFLNTYTNHKELNEKWNNSIPFKNIEIPNFLNNQMVIDMKNEITTSYSKYNHLLKNFTRNGSHMVELCEAGDICPIAHRLIGDLHSKYFIDWLEKVTGMDGLIPDPWLVGASYMRCYRGDSLQVHSDFNWNEKMKLHRALTLVIYLNPEWEEKWNGDIQLWNEDRTECVTKYYPSNGNLVFWEYSKVGFHGHPHPLNCPEHITRDGIRLFYYISDAEHKSDDAPHRSLYWFDEKTKEPFDKREIF